MNHSLAIGSSFKYRAVLKSLLRIGRYPEVDLTVNPRFFSCTEQGPNPLLPQSNRKDIRRKRSAERCCKSTLFHIISTSAFVQPNCPLRVTLITYDSATREGWIRACCTDGRKSSDEPSCVVICGWSMARVQMCCVDLPLTQLLFLHDLILAHVVSSEHDYSTMPCIMITITTQTVGQMSSVLFTLLNIYH